MWCVSEREANRIRRSQGKELKWIIQDQGKKEKEQWCGWVTAVCFTGKEWFERKKKEHIFDWLGVSEGRDCMRYSDLWKLFLLVDWGRSRKAPCDNQSKITELLSAICDHKISCSGLQIVMRQLIRQKGPQVRLAHGHLQRNGCENVHLVS